MKVRWTVRRVHRWIAVGIGGFLLLWLVSGIVMVLPASDAPASRAPLDLSAPLVSPAEAVAALGQRLGRSPAVTAATLRPIAGTPVYEIATSEGKRHLVEARSGRAFTVTPDIAERLARQALPSGGRLLRLDRLTAHTLGDPWGPRPAYRLVFDAEPATTYLVGIVDGTILRFTRWTRVQAVIGSLHTFEPLKLIARQEQARRGLLILASLVGIGVAGTGYYLALPRRRRST